MVNSGSHLPISHSGLNLARAAALAAVVATPLFFNVYSLSAFDAAKAALLNGLAAFIAVGLLAGGPAAWRDASRWPLFWPMLGIAAVCALATACSAQPGLSLRGAYTRGAGLLTLLSQMLTGLAFAVTIRDANAIRRVGRLIAWVSLPVALYALAQRAGLDPLTWNRGFDGRVTGTMGNPVFLGAWLAMLLPLTAGLLITARPSAAKSAGNSRTKHQSAQPPKPDSSGIAIFLRPAKHPLQPDRLAGLGYAGLFLLQFGALLGTGSRGPLLGALAGLGLLAGLRLFGTGRRRLTLAWFAILLALLAATGYALLARRAGTVAYRSRLWTNTIHLLQNAPPLVRTDGATAPGGMLRHLLGYGPETAGLLFSQHYDPRLGHLEERGRVTDRAHNLWLDWLLAAGGCGAAAFIWLLLMALRQIARVARHPAEPADKKVWAAALAGGLAAHLVETQFSLVTTVSGLFFWIYIGLLPSVGEAPAPPDSGPKTFSPLALLAAGILTFDFAVNRAWLDGADSAAALGAVVPLVIGLFMLAVCCVAWLAGLNGSRAAGWDNAKILLFITLAGYPAYRLGLHPILADMVFRQANLQYERGRWATARALAEEAATLAPDRAIYWAYAAYAAREQAQATSDAGQRDAAFHTALRGLDQAQAADPFNYLHAQQMGQTCAGWAAMTADPARQAERARAAEAHFARAATLSPNRPELWNRRAQLQIQQLGDPIAAERFLARALELDPEYPPTHECLGEHQLRLAMGQEPGSPAMQQALARAAQSFQRVLDLGGPEDTGQTWRIHLVLGDIALRRGRRAEARRHIRQAYELAPAAERDSIRRMLQTVPADGGDA